MTILRYTSLPVILLLELIFFSSVEVSARAISRPDEGGNPTEVKILIYVVDIDDIVSADQSFTANVFYRLEWYDQRLAHESPYKISLPLSEVWNPRVQIINQQRVWPSFPEIVEVESNSVVVYRQRVWGSFSQPMKLHDFPFDHHECHIHIVATGYSPEEVKFVPDPETPGGVTQKPSVSDWEIVNINMELSPAIPLPGEKPIAGYILTFKAKRKMGYFFYKIIIPLTMIVMMSWVVFWVDPKESGTQISVSVTTMLTLIAYRFSIGALLPRISYMTRLDYFIIGSTFLVFFSLIQVVITSFYARHGNLQRARRIDVWSRIFFPLMFVLMTYKTLIEKLLV